MIIESLYKDLVGESEHLEQSGKQIDKCIEELLAGKKRTMEQNEFENYRELLFTVANTAEECGFVSGFKYAVKMLLECMH